MVKTWVADFKRGRTSSNIDAERSGRPKSARMEVEDMVLKVHKIVLNDRRLKLVDIAKAVGISKERTHDYALSSERLGDFKLY
jgi:hypothetical protein